MKHPFSFYGLALLLILSWYCAGCSGSDNAQIGGYGGGGGAANPQVTAVSNLDNGGSPLRVGDWCEVKGSGFGASQQSGGASGYVAFSDGSTVVKASSYGIWSDSSIVCQVPQGAPIKNSSSRESLQVLVVNAWGASSASGGVACTVPGNPTPNPAPQPTPPVPSPSPSPTDVYGGGGVEITSARTCMGQRKAPAAIGQDGDPDEEQFTAFITDSSGQQKDITGDATWSVKKWGSGEAATVGFMDSGKKGLFKAGYYDGSSLKTRNSMEALEVKASYGGKEGTRKLVVGALEIPGATIAAQGTSINGVTVSAFSMGQYEVTNNEYCQFLNDMTAQGMENGYEGGQYWWYPSDTSSWSGIQYNYETPHFTIISPEKGTWPVNIVTWYGAVAYCNWLTKQHGMTDADLCYGPFTDDGSGRWGQGGASYHPERKGYRLATETEWEYACRIKDKNGAVSTTSYYWGDALSDSDASDPGWTFLWFWSNSKLPDLVHPAGTKKPNGIGLYDMSGSIYEWISDWYGDGAFPSDGFTGGSPTRNPKGPVTGQYRCLRGGCYDLPANACASGYRNSLEPFFYYTDVGFRVMRTK
ncbi:MAG: SUMF1/EgtB/PvdO family nonheme iron enzyme [Candidatus Eremiobacteraeota bacterium]|nr:SUMF1/EgtB/PvdO family nonheme iron enzyme [Candidatus Eremiobacteraeota bacterium]